MACITRARTVGAARPAFDLARTAVQQFPGGDATRASRIGVVEQPDQKTRGLLGDRRTPVGGSVPLGGQPTSLHDLSPLAKNTQVRQGSPMAAAITADSDCRRANFRAR